MPSLLRRAWLLLLLVLLVLLVATATAALLLLPLAILQHLLVHPPELDMPSCAVQLCPALLRLDPFLLLVATSITTIALLLLDISLRVHVTESGGLHARRSYTDLAPHVLLTKLCLLHTDKIKITVVSYLILNYGEISECTAPVPVSQFKPLRERPWSPSWRPQACAASIFRAWPTVRDGLGVRQQRWPWARWRARPSCRRPAASCQSRCPA